MKKPLQSRVWSVLLLALCGTFAVLTHARNRDYADEMSIWLDTVAKSPDNPRARNYLGIEYHKAGMPEEAFASFSKAVSLFPGYDLANNNLANMHALRGDHGKALEHYGISLKGKPNSIGTLGNLARTLEAADRLDEAAVMWRKALELNPKSFRTALALGKVLLRTGETEEADACLKRAFDLAKDKRVTGLEIIGHAVEFGRHSFALSWIDLLGKQYPGDVGIEYQTASVALKTGNPDDARRILEEIVRKDPTHFMACNDLGVVSIRKNDMTGAEGWFMKAVERNPDYTAAHFNLALLYGRSGDVERARKHLDVCRRLMPGNPKVEEQHRILHEKTKETSDERK